MKNYPIYEQYIITCSDDLQITVKNSNWDGLLKLLASDFLTPYLKEGIGIEIQDEDTRRTIDFVNHDRCNNADDVYYLITVIMKDWRNELNEYWEVLEKWGFSR